MTLRRGDRPLRDLAVWEESLLAFRRNLADIRTRWMRGDLDDLPEAVSAADHFLHSIPLVSAEGDSGPGGGESELQNLLLTARLGARKDAAARLIRDTLGEIEALLGEFRAARDAIRGEMASLGPTHSGVRYRLDRIA